MADTLNPTNYREKMAEAGWRDDALYERYERILEPEHMGEYVVNCEGGRVIVGTVELARSRQATEQFPTGKYTFRKIGWDYEGRLLTPRPVRDDLSK